MSAATGYGKEPEPSTTSSSVQLSQQCRHFEFPEILLATENFNESLVIGRGGFGKVYRGTFFNGSTTVIAAIKRLDSSSNQGAPEFWAEVEMLSKLRHCHLVSLFGYCNHEKEMILVYEYMPTGTLEDHLHKLGTPISWLQRLRICIGTARGLDYLHTGMGIDKCVIHRDVKSSNILLHESWDAKISDFGLSRIGPTNQASTSVSTLVKGTFGYLDPDYYETGKLTRKSDVYAFGVVLLEVLCRKRAVFDIAEQTLNLARWAQESIKKGSLKHIIDTGIRDEISPKCLKEFVRIVEGCLYGDPKQRSTMSEVVVALMSVLTLQEKIDNSLQPAGRTVFSRMVNIFSLPSIGNITRNSSTGEGGSGKVLSGQVIEIYPTNNNFVPCSPGVVTADAAKNFIEESFQRRPDLLHSNITRNSSTGEGGSGKVLSGRVIEIDPTNNNLVPCSPGDGTVDAAKNHIEESFQRHADLLVSADVDSFNGYCEINRYKVEEIIGKGSSGVVCSAYDTHHGEKVAIKKITSIFEHVSVATSILREIKLHRLLRRHPDIVEVKNILLPPSGREFKDIYLVFELMDSDLHQVIKANDDLTPEHHQLFLYQLLRGLKYLHTAYVFHRDLKPKNILASADFKLKICDFGCARVSYNNQPTVIFWTDYVGSRWYRAPELCGSFYSKQTPAIDIWSIGCIFAEILNGRPLFPGKNVVHQLDLITDLLGTPSNESMAKIANEKARRYLSNMRKKKPIPFPQNFPNADPLALRLLERMIAFDPRDRPTVEEALSDPYFNNMASIDKEPSSQPISKLEFEFEKRSNTTEDLRKLIYREILEYHPIMLKEFLNGAEPTGFMYPSVADQFKKQFALLDEHDAKGTKVAPLERQRSSSLPRAGLLYSNETAQGAVEVTNGLSKHSIKEV